MLTKSLTINLPPAYNVNVFSRIQEEFPSADVFVDGDTKSVKLTFLFLNTLLEDEDLIINRVKEILSEY